MTTFGEIDVKLDGIVVTIAFDREANWWSDVTIPSKYADLIQSKVNAEFEGAGYIMRADLTLSMRRIRL